MMKETMKKAVGKMYMAGVGVSLAMVPGTVGAEAPSVYVNKVTKSIYDELAKISLNLALVALIGFIIAYMTSGDDHKKAKIKWSGVGVVTALLTIGVLPSLVSWVQGLIS